ncbi:MAG TPA: class I SAM-dependent methyltransferase, partial [Candidatus Acidoferrum sp.]|nr:class I SAM-dependent methyltransferase [Candidatus Acidoferrum sp.]
HSGVSETDRIARAYRELEAGAGSRWDLSNHGNRMVLAERRRLASKLLGEAGWIPLSDRRVLEVGCGGGSELGWMLELGASPSSLVGVDLLPDRVAAARRTYPKLEFHMGNAEQLDFPDGSFDLVMAFTVFTSILDESMARNVASEIQRVLRPGGGLLWYDFRYNSPANHNVRGVGSQRVRDLFPELQGDLHSITLLPPLARRLGPLTAPAYHALASLPPLRSHLMGLLRKAA